MANLLNCLKTALSDVAMGWGVSPDYHALAGMRSALATDLVAEFRQELTDRYVVEDEIGRGGMALVFLATDRRHDRKVALKVLRPERAFQVGRERFLREIRLAAQLAHPHILPVYDSGEAAGLLYFVMPHVEGGSLRERLQREHRLSLEDASQITHDVAGALDYAHRHHVVHRDIKPENVMLQLWHREGVQRCWRPAPDRGGVGGRNSRVHEPRADVWRG